MSTGLRLVAHCVSYWIRPSLNLFLQSVMRVRSWLNKLYVTHTCLPA
jgi:hypothetical protein